MHYHLNRQGQDPEVLSLDELRLRRQSGGLTGSEYVWTEGMADWAPLDAVLQGAYPDGPSPPVMSPDPVASASGTRWLGWALALGSVVILAGLAATALLILPRIASKAPPETEWIEEEFAWEKIRIPPNTKTEADAKNRGREFRTRLWLEGYKENGDRSMACDAEVVQLIEAWIDANFGEPRPGRTNIVQWCHRIAAMPDCNDPLVLTMLGLNAGERPEQIRRLNRALAGFNQSKHKAYPKFYAAMAMHGATADPNLVNRSFETALAHLKECFEDGSFRPEDQAEIAEILVQGGGSSFFSRVPTDRFPVSSQPGSPFEWLALVLEGDRAVEEAWKARGTGYAHKVNEEGWKGFNTHLATARDRLTRAWQLRPDLAIAPARMIGVAMGDSGAKEMRLWFDRALAAQMDYPQAWSAMRWGLRPRWHGSHDLMLALGNSAVDTGRFDTDMPLSAYDVVSDLWMDLELRPGQHLFGRGDIWPMISRMYEGFIAEPSRAAVQPGWRSTYAVIAYLGGKLDVARVQLELVDWAPWTQNLAGRGRELALLPLEVAARTGAAAAQVTEAERSYRAANLTEALDRYKAVAGLPDLDERTSTFVRCRLAILDLETRLASGEWVDFLPSNPVDPAWILSAGDLQVLADNSIETRSSPPGHLLHCLARVGMNFELRGEFEIAEDPNGAFQAGIAMGLPNLNAAAWRAFRIIRTPEDGAVASFSIAWTDQQVVQPVRLEPGRNTFEFHYKNRLTTATVNGAQVFLDVQPPRATTPISDAEFLLGLGGLNNRQPSTVRYHRVQVRRVAPPTVAR